jgi:hypothetical protein
VICSKMCSLFGSEGSTGIVIRDNSIKVPEILKPQPARAGTSAL